MPGERKVGKSIRHIGTRQTLRIKVAVAPLWSSNKHSREILEATLHIVQVESSRLGSLEEITSSVAAKRGMRASVQWLEKLGNQEKVGRC